MAIDPIDVAIARSDPAAAPAPAPTTNLAVTLSSGRQIGLLVPTDLTVRETLEIANFVTGGLAGALHAQPAPASRLLVPSHLARG